jgi:2-amino-4-hydroxy-6-hydroxymethyldihydropteridine diphosphokinase
VSEADIAPGVSSVVIAFGSNQGDREAILSAAVRDVAAIDGVTVTAVSGLVESFAVKLAGVDETAPNYLNGVLTARTSLTPEQLLDELQRIELEHGRVRLERWGDRTLDLDLIAVTDAEGIPVQQTSERLTLPHPRAWQRAFVLAPWMQIEPHAVLPGHWRIAELLEPIADSVWEHPSSEFPAPGEGEAR